MNVSSLLSAYPFAPAVRTAHAPSSRSSEPMPCTAPAEAPVPRRLIELDKSRLGGLKHASPEVRDRLARAALLANARLHGPAIGISDDAPENKFAEVRVGGKVVATLYNGGSSVMSNDAFARIGHLNEPSIVGPDLAKWRAETYARLLGGTVEIATTAMRQEDWKPRTETTPTYSQEELDRAFEFTQRLAEHRRATFSAKLASLAGTADLRV